MAYIVHMKPFYIFKIIRIELTFPFLEKCFCENNLADAALLKYKDRKVYRILSCLLCFCLLAGYSPKGAFESYLLVLKQPISSLNQILSYK